MPKSPEKKPKTKQKFDLSSIAILFLPVAFLLGIGGGWVMWGQDAGSGNSRNSGAVFNPDGGDPFLGPEDVPITIVEFSDYQCPYCRVWYEEVLVKLLADYPNQIRFVYRDFPLTSIHPGAEPAAQAANCAGEQEKYYEYHNAIFSGQYDLTRDGFLSIANDLGLNTDNFTECIDSGRQADEIQEDLEDALNIGVQSTPTFYINGTLVVGAQPYATFKNYIDQILAGSE